ncbi:MAG: response regulator [Dehalococcoidia bacterium]
MSKIRVFLVDDHYVVCEGLRRMLEQEEDLCVVGDAQTGEETLMKLRQIPADVVLLDVRLGGMDGIETLKELKASQPELKVIMLTSYGDEYLNPSIEAGATGYLLKRANRAEMVKAIHEAVQGGAPLDSLVTSSLLSQLRNPSEDPWARITPRQTQVLELAAAGLCNKEIGCRLGVKETTIKNQMTSVMQRLDANDRTHAVMIAVRKGLISNPN